MKTGVYIRVGAKNVDIIDADLLDLINWLNTLSPTELVRLVVRLLDMMRGR